VDFSLFFFEGHVEGLVDCMDTVAFQPLDVHCFLVRFETNLEREIQNRENLMVCFLEEIMRMNKL